MGIFSNLKRKTKNKAVFLGLDGSGKSTIISFLQEGRFIKHTPTMGKQKREFNISGTKMSLFDMGGQEDFRDLWLGELRDSKCVVFVIDKNREDRFDEAREEFNKILPLVKKRGIKLLVLVNKHDLSEANSVGKITRYFNLIQLESFELLEISAKTGYNMADAFTKFYSLLTDEHIEKNVLTRAISIYNASGNPIITQCDTSLELDTATIEGKFKVFVTKFTDSQESAIHEETVIKVSTRAKMMVPLSSQEAQTSLDHSCGVKISEFQLKEPSPRW
ncbi:MAG: ADP-ribosylation factor-like protein [Promethearchaeota archaeon]